MNAVRETARLDLEGKIKLGRHVVYDTGAVDVGIRVGIVVIRFVRRSLGPEESARVGCIMRKAEPCSALSLCSPGLVAFTTQH